jgi:hypothetical protein
MKKILLILFSFSCINTANAQMLQWQSVVFAENPGIGWAEDIIQDDAGNIYMAGGFHNTLNVGPYSLTSAGSVDIAIVKFNSAGQVIWAKRAGGPDEDDVGGLCIDSAGNIYNTGFFQGVAYFGLHSVSSSGLRDIYLTKIDSAGNFIWTKKWGGIYYDHGLGLNYDHDGQVNLIGYCMDTVAFGSFTLYPGASQDILMLHIDTAGNVIWAKNVGNINTDSHGVAVRSDSAGCHYITGDGTGTTMNFDGNQTNNTDVFVVKYDPAGNAIWARSIEALGNLPLFSTSIAIDENGNVYTAGYTHNSQAIKVGNVVLSNDHAYIAKYDASGSLLWAKNPGINSNTTIKEIILDAAKNIFLAGSYTNQGIYGQDTLPGNGWEDIAILKLDSNGNNISATWAGAGGNDVATGIVLENNGDLLVCGYAVGPAIPFGSVTATTNSGNGMDMFLARLSQTTGIRQVNGSAQKFEVYPNPAEDLVYINVREGGRDYELRDLSGKKILTGNLRTGSNTLDLGQMKAGIYLLYAGNEVHKIVKQ